MSYVVRIVFGKVINVSFFSCSGKKPDISIKVSVEGKIEDGNDTSDSEEGESPTKWAVIGINDSIEGNVDKGSGTSDSVDGELSKKWLETGTKDSIFGKTDPGKETKDSAVGDCWSWK